MIEPMAGTHSLCRHIAASIGVDWRLKRHPARNFNPGSGEAIELCRIVSEQSDTRAVQHPEHARGAIIALIIIETKRVVRIEGVETFILQLIGSHFVGKTEPAAFLRQIKNNAAAEVFDARQSEPKLVATVTAPRAKHVPGQTGGMQPNRDGTAEIRAAHNDGNGTATQGIATHDKAPRRPGA